MQQLDLAGAFLVLPILLVYLLLRSSRIDAKLLQISAAAHTPSCRCSKTRDVLTVSLSGPTIKTLSYRKRVVVKLLLPEVSAVCQCVTAIDLGNNAILIPQSVEDDGIGAYFEPEGSKEQRLTVTLAGFPEGAMCGILVAEVNGQQDLPILLKPPCPIVHGLGL